MNEAEQRFYNGKALLQRSTMTEARPESAIEKLWDKYDQPLHRILQERDNAAVELSKYLKELGYE